MTAVSSSSVQSMQVPIGGIAPTPAFAFLNITSNPFSIRGAHSVLSFATGAPCQPPL